MPLLTLPQAVELRLSLQSQNRKVILTNGVFDLLHVGHLAYLEKARGLGDALLVGVNGDESARQLKGGGRPLVPAADRARLLAALRCVEAAIIFEELTAVHLLKSLKPDVYVKGGDYRDKPLPESGAAGEVGAQIVLIDYVAGQSTTALIEKIVKGLNR
jgi:rfaE bifunctional protein nucleotidyltransferase chain/domain